MEFITYPQTNTETMLRIISECGKETGIIYCSWVNVASQNLSEKYYPDERMHSYISGIVKSRYSRCLTSSQGFMLYLPVGII